MAQNNATLGHFTWNFLASPAKLSTTDFFGVAFIVVALTLYWSKFVNSLA